MKRLFTLIAGLSCLALNGMDDKGPGDITQEDWDRAEREAFVVYSDGSQNPPLPMDRATTSSGYGGYERPLGMPDASDVRQNIQEMREWGNQGLPTGLNFSSSTNQSSKNSPAKNLNDYKKLVSSSIVQMQEHINKAKAEIKNLQNKLRPIRNKQKQVRLALDSIRGRRSHSGRVPLGKQFGELGSKIKGLEQQVNNKTQLIKNLQDQIKQQQERIARLNNPIPNYVYADIKKTWDTFCSREKSMQVAKKVYSQNQHKLQQLRKGEKKYINKVKAWRKKGSPDWSSYNVSFYVPPTPDTQLNHTRANIKKITDPYQQAQKSFNQARQQLEKAQYPSTLHNELTAYKVLIQQEVTNNPADADAQNKLTLLNRTIQQKGKTSTYTGKLSTRAQNFIKTHGKNSSTFIPPICNPLQGYYYNKIKGHLEESARLYSQYSSRKSEIDANLEEGVEPERIFREIVDCSQQAISSAKQGEFYVADMLSNCTNLLKTAVSACLNDPVHAGWGLFQGVARRAVYTAALTTAFSYLPASVAALLIPVAGPIATCLTIAGVIGIVTNFNEIQTWWDGLDNAQRAESVGELVGSLIPLPCQERINQFVQRNTKKYLKSFKRWNINRKINYYVKGLKTRYKARLDRLKIKVPKRRIKHVQGNHTYQTHRSNASIFNRNEDIIDIGLEAWENGTPVPGDSSAKTYDFGRLIGKDRSGVQTSKVKVIVESKEFTTVYPIER